VIDGEIYLSERGGAKNELVVYSRAGDHLREVPLSYDVLALGGDNLGGGSGGRLFAIPDDGSGDIVELNPFSGTELNRFAAPETPSGQPIDGLAFDGSSLFYLNGSGSGLLWALNPNTGAVDTSVNLGHGNFTGLATLDGSVYVTDADNNDILEVDPGTGSVSVAIDLDFLNPGVAVGTSLAGVTGMFPPGEQLDMLAAAVNGTVVLTPEPGAELRLDGFVQRQSRRDARLVVDPGVIVKVNDSRIEAEKSAQLIAEGSDDLRVVFTSLMDERFGMGGTFATQEIPTPEGPVPGDWGGLYFAPLSSGSIDRAYVGHGGGATRIEGELVLTQANLSGGFHKKTRNHP